MRERLSRVEEELQEINPRWRLINWILFGTGILLAGRLWFLQMIHGEQLRQYSEINRLKETKIPAPRGLIFDRYHKILVDNLPGLELTITPQYAEDLDLLAKKISPIIKIAPKQIIEKIKTGERKYGPFRPVTIKKYLSLNQASHLKLLKWDHAGLDIQETIIRYYPLKKNGAHLFGYLGEISRNQMPKFRKKYAKQFDFKLGDMVGKSGLEANWESELRGEDGFSFVEVDVYNRKPSSTIAGLWTFKPKKPVAGKNLILTLDKKLQEKAYKSLFRKDKRGVRHGSILVMKSNGEILVWISYPSYDPNTFSTILPTKDWLDLVQDSSKPLRNKIIQDHYPPGSVFKPIVALAALQEGYITPKSLVDSPATLTFGRRTYHDYGQIDHGALDLASAIERSANVFFYKLGIGLKIDLMAKYAKLMNLGRKTNIKMEREVSGFVPDSKWKMDQLGEAWQPGENLSHAIGQGFILVTPLQMAVAYNAIATSGKIVKPFVVKKIIDTNNKEIQNFQPEVIRHIGNQIEKKHFETIRKALTRVVHGPHGTAKWFAPKSVKIAGKTGTAQVMSFSKDNIYKKCSTRPREQRHHGWFVAFAPAENPEIIVSTLTEHSCSGSGGSAPIVRDIIQFYFDNKRQKNDKSYTHSSTK